MKGMGYLSAPVTVPPPRTMSRGRYNGLAGGDGSLRLVKSQQHLPVFAARKGRCLVFLTVTVLGAHANAAGIEFCSMRSAGALQIQSSAVSACGR